MNKNHTKYLLFIQLSIILLHDVYTYYVRGRKSDEIQRSSSAQ